jgi:hypothetical protein
VILLKELLAEPKGYKLFVDMDGVIVDFRKGWETTMEEPLGAPLKGAARTEFWKRFRNKLRDKGMTEREWWATLPWTRDGKALWSFVKPHSPTILSAPTVTPDSKAGKRDWLKTYLSSTPAIIDYDKAKYARPDRILIDDRKDFIAKWTAAGGVGILHKNTPQTILHLKSLGVK